MYNDRWVFFKTHDKRRLSHAEVNYWRNNLNKIMKVGLEFEFNLPTSKGKCKGKSYSCPCIKFPDNDCWKECANEAKCKNSYGDNFESKCSGIYCSSFTMACSACDDFELDCESCKYRYNPDKDPDNIRNYFRDCLTPSKSYGKINSSGVYNVVCDGSLLGTGREGKGAEIITIGRRIDYWEFFKMNSTIVEKAMEKKAYMNERCSVHVHILASYYNDRDRNGRHVSNELEKPLPQIVLANFHQLCRRYQNAITWMSMGLDGRKRMTRWEKYRVSVLHVSPVRLSMPSVREKIASLSNKANGKYGWVNYMFTEFDHNNDISKLHLEMRPMDGIMSASIVTALSCLFHAMLIKAVEISKYGLLEVGSKGWMENAADIKEKILNNMSDWNSGDRFSHTDRLTRDDMHMLTNEAMDLVNQVKHILLKTGPAYEVLEKLAYEPAAMLRCNGLSWSEIEDKMKVVAENESLLEHGLLEIIDLRSVVGCGNENEWVVKVSGKIGTDDTDTIQRLITDHKNNGDYIWSGKLGAVLRV